MIKCPVCQVMHVPNTIFCKNCGICLLKNDTPRTDDLEVTEDQFRTSKMPTLNKGADELVDTSLGDKNPDRADGTPKKPEPTLKIESTPMQVTIRLKIGTNNREVEIPLRKGIHIGRIDPNAEIFPEIDLTNDIAPAKDVSRRHARISRKNGKVVVQDLASSNGTFLNGKRLESYHKKPLENGDVLQLGTTQIEVKILAQ